MSAPDCSRCTLHRKAQVVENKYREAPDHLAKIGAQRAEIEALRANNRELRSMTASFIVAVFLWAMGGTDHG